MIYLLTFLLGIAISYIASIPVGAVNMAVVQATLNDRKRSALFIGFGAIIVEALYCAVPLFGVKALAKGTAVFDWMVIGSVPVLIFLGILSIVRRRKEANKTQKEIKGQGNPLKEMLYGITLCGTNPMIMIFWTQITFFLDHKGLLANTPEELVFWAAVPIGTFILYLTFIFISNRTKRFFSVESKVKVNVAVGIIFICLGVYLGVSYYIGHKGNLKPGNVQVDNQPTPKPETNLLPFQLEH